MTLSDRLREREEETARFTAYVNDPERGAYPNERLAVRVAEANLALASEAVKAARSGLASELCRALVRDADGRYGADHWRWRVFVSAVLSVSDPTPEQMAAATADLMTTHHIQGPAVP